MLHCKIMGNIKTDKNGRNKNTSVFMPQNQGLLITNVNKYSQTRYLTEKYFSLFLSSKTQNLFKLGKILFIFAVPKLFTRVHSNINHCFVIRVQFHLKNMLNKSNKVFCYSREFVITVIVITKYDCIQQCFSTYLKLRTHSKIFMIWRSLNASNSTIYSEVMEPSKELAEPRLKNTGILCN